MKKKAYMDMPPTIIDERPAIKESCNFSTFNAKGNVILNRMKRQAGIWDKVKNVKDKFNQKLLENVPLIDGISRDMQKWFFKHNIGNNAIADFKDKFNDWLIQNGDIVKHDISKEISNKEPQQNDENTEKVKNLEETTFSQKIDNQKDEKASEALKQIQPQLENLYEEIKTAYKQDAIRQYFDDENNYRVVTVLLKSLSETEDLSKEMQREIKFIKDALNEYNNLDKPTKRFNSFVSELEQSVKIDKLTKSAISSYRALLFEAINAQNNDALSIYVKRNNEALNKAKDLLTQIGNQTDNVKKMEKFVDELIKEIPITGGNANE